MDCFDQNLIDKTLIEMDGTTNKSNLGANAILGSFSGFSSFGIKS